MEGPIIVVGTGRSGTSTVARILHEKLGVCMGHFLRIHTVHDYYEDLLAHALNRMLGDHNISVLDWRLALAKAHMNCDDWGFKDPYFLYAPVDAIKKIQPRLFVRTWRSMDETVDSWIRHNKKIGGKGSIQHNKIHFSRVCLEREMLMDWKLEGYPVVEIRFDRRLSDEEIADKIRTHLIKKEVEEEVKV